ncbi:MAG: glycoside hydrolase family 9 protein [Lachnospiraceae bacterium]|nr:glycoside hydrolase family 9 protein [Lachnospiraceae bacterium]
MRKMKKIAAVSMAAVIMLSAYGCGGKKSDDNAATNTDAERVTEDLGPAPVIEDNEDWTTTEEPYVEDNRFTTVEGADVLGINFDDGDTSGFTTYVNGGEYSIYVEDGELVADIIRTGSVEHGCQLYYDGFTMARGCVYTVSFDVHSDIPCNLEWRIQVNGGDYHAYASEKVALTSEVQSIDYQFTMNEESDPAPRFAINMGAFEENGGDVGAHKIYFDNFSLFVTDSSNAEKIEGAPTPIQVKVNQIGYAPDDYKTVVVTSKEDEKFKIVDAETGDTVYIGEYGDKLYDTSVESGVRLGDFSDFKYSGKYKIVSSPSGESYDFEIGYDLYDDIFKDVILMLYKQRCGCEISEDIAGDFAHAACHTENAIVYGSTSSSTVDVSGGWHDAGDYGRYVVPGAKTVQDLFLTYEDFNISADDIGIPESGNGIPDLLDEAKYELDWMLKMQDQESGGVYHKVTALVFPETVLAVDETDQLVLAPISYAATGDFAAVMAKASVLYAEYDKDFADKCLEAAKNAYAFLEANEDMKGYKNPEEIVTGEYPDGTIADEKMWAAAELYLATKDDKYLSVVKEMVADKPSKGLGWADIGGYALYDLANANDVDESVKESAKTVIINGADTLLERCKKAPFFMGLNSYPWGSNMSIANNGMLFLMANRISPNVDYAEYAQRHRDYIFGVNGTGYCYVTGYGDLSPEHTLHRRSQVLGETMPGMLVGGPDNALEDPYAKAVLYGYAAALAYVDNEQSYSCNEITIYWNSPLIYLMGAFQ